jgi:hypothetical protein
VIEAYWQPAPEIPTQAAIDEYRRHFFGFELSLVRGVAGNTSLMVLNIDFRTT